MTLTLQSKSHDYLPAAAHEATGAIAGFPHEPHLPFIKHHVRNDIDINQGCYLDPEVPGWEEKKEYILLVGVGLTSTSTGDNQLGKST